MAALPAGAATFTVAPNGNDSNPGTAQKPFATLARAQAAARTAKSAGAITVEVRGGLYEMQQPVALTEEDSGTVKKPITWHVAKGEIARLVGGRFVSGWKKVTDTSVLSRLDPAARGKVFQADLKAQGITDYGELKSASGWGSSEPGLQVFQHEKPLTLARWPNGDAVAPIKDVPVLDYDVRGTRGTSRPEFIYDGDRPSRWAGESNIMLHGYWFWDWADQRYHVKSIDTDKKLITMDAARVDSRKGQWYYAYNILSELDTPGEWYLDREKGVLYLWPIEPLEKSKVMVSIIPNLVTLNNASFVTFKGFTMEGCRGTAVEIRGGTGNRVIGCTIRNTGSFAVRVEGGKNHGVIGCDMYQMGDGGVVLHGGDAKTLTHAEHFAENNHIHHFSLWNPMYKVGVEMVGVGMRASHNLVDHAPHVGISFCGQENIVEYNEIHNVVEHANDAGAIYTQPGVSETWTMRGNIVRYNYLHNIYGYRGEGCDGVYLDDMFSSIHCYGNLFYQVPAACFVGGGRDNIFENNIFVDCSPSIHVDARATNWAGSGLDDLRRDLESIPYKTAPWSERYPQLLTLLDDEPAAPKGNVFARNISVGGRWDDIEGIAKPYVKFENNLIGEDPHFVDPKKLDFRLKADSPAWKIGFKPIPIEKIGLYQDNNRASWPVIHPSDPAPAVRTSAELLRYPNPVAVPKLTASLSLPTTGNWPGVSLKLAENSDRNPIKGAACTSHVAHDGKYLYVSLDVPVKDPTALKLGDTWGQVDGMEVCFRDASNPQKLGSIFVLQGYPTGKFNASTNAGATPQAAAKLGAVCKYSAQLTPTGWRCEWSIPLAAAGITVKPGLTLGFNIGLLRTEDSEWIVWAGPNGPTWKLGGAGLLKLR